MAVFTERQAIQQRMVDIREERRELGNEYYRLMDRLRDLDSFEKEAIDSEAVVGSLTEAIKTLERLIPHIPATALIRQVAEVMKENDVEIEIDKEQEKPQVAPSHVITAQQARDAEKIVTTKKRIGRVNREDILPVVKTILLEHGAPMKLEQLQQKASDAMDYDFKKVTFQGALSNLMIKDSRLTRPVRGYYQYQM
jgi:hypothetical protein